MNKAVGNALLYLTRQPAICFTERAQGIEPAGTRRDGMSNMSMEKIGESTPRESPLCGRWKDRGRTCVLCSLTPS